MIQNFSFDKISLGGPVFDLVKLGWVNNHHMRLKDLDELTKLAIPYFVQAGYYENENLSAEEFSKLKRIVEITREGSQTLKELPVNAAIYFEDKFELPIIEEGNHPGTTYPDSRRPAPPGHHYSNNAEGKSPCHGR